MGHPGRRKAPQKAWSKHMIAIYIADAVAEEIRTSGREVKTRVEWQNGPDWTLVWRGRQLRGELRKQLKSAVGVERFRQYVTDRLKSKEFRARRRDGDTG